MKNKIYLRDIILTSIMVLIMVIISMIYVVVTYKYVNKDTRKERATVIEIEEVLDEDYAYYEYTAITENGELWSFNGAKEKYSVGKWIIITIRENETKDYVCDDMIIDIKNFK